MDDPYLLIRDGLLEAFRTVLSEERVLRHPPTSGGDVPLLFVTRGTYAREGMRPIQHTFGVACWLVVANQDPAGAEQLLDELMWPLMSAVNADPKLGNRLTAANGFIHGHAWISDYVDGDYFIGGVPHRTVRMTATVEIKEQFG